ncbi:MAG: hypothetical protein ABW119_22655, partial [Candidatus Thiodiazotropha lotti]
VAEVFDDLGPEGIDHVVFYVNGQPDSVVYSSRGQVTGSHAQAHVYEASIAAPSGVNGFVIQAIAYDVLGQTGESQEVLVGRVEDTVVPRVSILTPLDREILTTAESLKAVVAVEDIGALNHQVTMTWYREFQNAQGLWESLNESTRELFRDDTRAPDDNTPVSDPANHYYIYWDNFSDGTILQRSDGRNERVRSYHAG